MQLARYAARLARIQQQVKPRIHPFTPPSFADRFAYLSPTDKLSLAMTPTPIQTLNVQQIVPDIPTSISVDVKREDMTGTSTSGSKIRKLEFTLAEAFRRQCDSVITCGALQSNHTRCTSVAARELGFDVHVFLHTNKKQMRRGIESNGNLFFHRMLGVNAYLVPSESYTRKIDTHMHSLKLELVRKGHRAQVIDMGGSNRLGLWGDILAFEELLQQGAKERYTDIVLPSGSASTASGFAIANYLCGSPFRIHSVSVENGAYYVYSYLNSMLELLDMQSETHAKKLLNVMVAIGSGYNVNSRNELEMCVKVAGETGIMLDPIYSLKAFYRLMMELKTRRRAFSEPCRILFVQTGAVYPLLDGRIFPFLRDSRIKEWNLPQIE
ncbi:1-aminocyclopropane-1-carboxylate deaminase/D-cysteine desulfhydrase [Gracilaria domingensis]|nr:1-aminocyclopropane-1-carboxylate deaminase/D-cysteine desulfhydrase [Gracilaria domingensis]